MVVKTLIEAEEARPYRLQVRAATLDHPTVLAEAFSMPEGRMDADRVADWGTEKIILRAVSLI